MLAVELRLENVFKVADVVVRGRVGREVRARDDARAGVDLVRGSLEAAHDALVLELGDVVPLLEALDVALGRALTIPRDVMPDGVEQLDLLRANGALPIFVPLAGVARADGRLGVGHNEGEIGGHLHERGIIRPSRTLRQHIPRLYKSYNHT